MNTDKKTAPKTTVKKPVTAAPKKDNTNVVLEPVIKQPEIKVLRPEFTPAVIEHLLDEKLENVVMYDLNTKTLNRDVYNRFEIIHKYGINKLAESFVERCAKRLEFANCEPMAVFAKTYDDRYSHVEDDYHFVGWGLDYNPRGRSVAGSVIFYNKEKNTYECKPHRWFFADTADARDTAAEESMYLVMQRLENSLSDMLRPLYCDHGGPVCLASPDGSRPSLSLREMEALTEDMPVPTAVYNIELGQLYKSRYADKKINFSRNDREVVTEFRRCYQQNYNPNLEAVLLIARACKFWHGEYYGYNLKHNLFIDLAKTHVSTKVGDMIIGNVIYWDKEKKQYINHFNNRCNWFYCGNTCQDYMLQRLAHLLSDIYVSKTDYLWSYWHTEVR